MPYTKPLITLLSGEGVGASILVCTRAHVIDEKCHESAACSYLMKSVQNLIQINMNAV